MRKTILTGMVLILMFFLLPSCAAGVSQGEYDRISSDLAAAQTQIQSLQADLSKAQAQNQSLQADLSKAQAQNQSLQANLSTEQVQVQSLQGDLTEAQAQNQSLQGDLTEAQAQIQSLQSGKGGTEEKCAEALAYAEYLDILMNPLWKDAGLTPRFVFEDDIEWMLELRGRARDMGNTELTSYVKELEGGSEAAMTELWGYCLDRIEKALK